jgi:hypothetical protein
LRNFWLFFRNFETGTFPYSYVAHAILIFLPETTHPTPYRFGQQASGHGSGTAFNVRAFATVRALRYGSGTDKPSQQASGHGPLRSRSGTTTSDQAMDVEPDVIEHPPQDHRYVHPEEVKKLGAYKVIMSRPHSTIRDYAMTAKNFLKSTSSWSELHIIAFRCLILNNLPISRVLPHSELVRDDDETMKLVFQHLSASEDDVRSRQCLESLGPATIFYQQLQVVIRRPGTPPDSIRNPRVLRESSRLVVFPAISESDTAMSTDSSYQPPPEVRVTPPDRPRPSMVITDQRSSSRASVDMLPPKASLDTQKTDSSVSSSASALDEDKLEMCANQAVVSLLGLLFTPLFLSRFFSGCHSC